MVVLDSTVVNIALPSAQADLGFSDGDRQWIVTASSLAFGSLLLLGGRLSDLMGRKRTFIIGLLLGGYLTAVFDWRWNLYINVFIAIIAIVGVIFFVSNAKRTGPRPKLDIPGIVLVSGALFGLVYGFSNAETDGWDSPLAWGIFLFVTYYLQTSLYTPIQTGLSFLPMIAMLVLASQLSTNIFVPRFGPKVMVPFGMALGAIGMVLPHPPGPGQHLRGRHPAAPDDPRLRHGIHHALFRRLGHGVSLANPHGTDPN
jgi:MFS family permease